QGTDIAATIPGVLTGTEECTDFGQCVTILRDAVVAGDRATISFTGRMGPLELDAAPDPRRGQLRTYSWTEAGAIVDDGADSFEAPDWAAGCSARGQQLRLDRDRAQQRPVPIMDLDQVGGHLTARMARCSGGGDLPRPSRTVMECGHRGAHRLGTLPMDLTGPQDRREGGDRLGEG